MQDSERATPSRQSPARFPRYRRFLARLSVSHPFHLAVRSSERRAGNLLLDHSCDLLLLLNLSWFFGTPF
jgi:hypothetical protein